VRGRRTSQLQTRPRLDDSAGALALWRQARVPSLKPDISIPTPPIDPRGSRGHRAQPGAASGPLLADALSGATPAPDPLDVSRWFARSIRVSDGDSPNELIEPVRCRSRVAAADSSCTADDDGAWTHFGDA
jgi:hypothetical protein